MLERWLNRRTCNTIVKRNNDNGLQNNTHNTIEQYEPHFKLEVNLDVPEGGAVHVPLLAPVVLSLCQKPGYKPRMMQNRSIC